MSRVLLAIGLLVISCGAGLALAAPYRLPVEQRIPVAQASAARLVAVHCTSCHSLDYIGTQPPGQGAAFWNAEVQKMITVYGAAIPADRASVIAGHLAQTR